MNVPWITWIRWTLSCNYLYLWYLKNIIPDLKMIQQKQINVFEIDSLFHLSVAVCSICISYSKKYWTYFCQTINTCGYIPLLIYIRLPNITFDLQIKLPRNSLVVITMLTPHTHKISQQFSVREEKNNSSFHYYG